MKLRLEELNNKLAWKNYRMPTYDIKAVREKTRREPTWLHFGAGNIFRAYPAVLSQRLLTAGLTDRGIIVCEGYDEELIERVYHAHDDLSVRVILHSDGSLRREVIGSICESLTMSGNQNRLHEIFCNPSLQIVTFTITEKAYYLRNVDRSFRPDVQADMDAGPDGASTMFGRIAALCVARYRACDTPLALVSLDNCDNNGDRLRRAVMDIVLEWHKKGFITDADLMYMHTQVSFPLSMIDKITPAPADRVAAALKADGLDETTPFVTEKGTRAAIFVNTEAPHYLLIENSFPNGHPPLEQLGIILTKRAIVERAAAMKACTCLNPLDTATGLFGSMLGYHTICDQMQDENIPALLRGISRESIEVVEDPGVLDPEAFLHEVLSVRYPNPFMPDTPQRICTDTSQKMAIRYGVTLRRYYNSKVPMHRISRLTFIPLAIAGWLRYLMGVDDEGNEMQLSPDPLMDSVKARMGGITFGDTEFKEKALYGLLSDVMIFGVNLNEVGAAERVIEMFREMNAGPGAVRATLRKYAAK